ncbi:MAG: pyroglutamyl-peptidase I [Rhizobiaceae bacterium]|nr:pyroglutamyl-peptidase I [Rhizobiaceae bacterium]
MLVTGFEPFPGAPVNPTQALVQWLSKHPPRVEGMGALRAEVLPVEYGAVAPRLSRIGREFGPDIALHFGLALGCNGFRLERTARNRFAAARPDNSGAMPPDGPICAGPAALPSTLPLEAIHAALAAARLPVEWSDDAGGYLCNMAMTLSLARACDGFNPRVCGFIHVPPVGAGEPLSMRDLRRGAGIVLSTTVAAWTAG